MEIKSMVGTVKTNTAMIILFVLLGFFVGGIFLLFLRWVKPYSVKKKKHTKKT